MQPIEQLTHILPALCNTVDRIEVDQLDDPTPCSEFTVHDVLDHMIVGGRTFSHLFRGEEPPAVTAPPVYGWVAASEFREAMDELLTAVRSPGAMDRTIPAPMGEMRGSAFARFVAFDGLVHGWDLATATGHDFAPSPDVVAAVDAFIHEALTPDLRDGDTFAEATDAPADASALERVAAFSGRTV